MLKPDMKRFYREVTVASTPDDVQDAAGFRVLLDGRQVKSPSGRTLAVPTPKLAEAMAEEWDAQEEKILPATMPLTQLSFTAIDRIAPEQEDVAARIAKYGETDLLCYRAESPADLVKRQAGAWDPLLAWAGDELGARLSVTGGILPVSQPEAALKALSAAVRELEPFRLTALASVVQAAGSLIVGMALVRGHLTAEGAIEASQLDESYQSEKWGEDKESVERLKGLQAEISQAETFLGLL